jgi:excinuclease ABC subunit C
VVRRRYARLLEEGASLPDLVVIDGGKGQLSAAVGILEELGLSSQPVIGLAKRLEEVFVPGESLPMNIARTSPGLHLLQRVRDEAHRFAVTFHRARRSKATLQSELEDIEGVGVKRAQQLLTTFGSVRSIGRAPAEELAAVVGWTAARSIHEWFNSAGEAPGSADAADAVADSDVAEGTSVHSPSADLDADDCTREMPETGGKDHPDED